MEIGCTRCMGDGGVYPEGSLTKVACPECCNKKLEQENAALRARWEKLKGVLKRDFEAAKHTSYRALDLIRKIEELEQDD